MSFLETSIAHKSRFGGKVKIYSKKLDQPAMTYASAWFLTTMCCSGAGKCPFSHRLPMGMRLSGAIMILAARIIS